MDEFPGVTVVPGADPDRLALLDRDHALEQELRAAAYQTALAVTGRILQRSLIEFIT